jgi:hypothetical protein
MFLNQASEQAVLARYGTQGDGASLSPHPISRGGLQKVTKAHRFYGQHVAE